MFMHKIQNSRELWAVCEGRGRKKVRGEVEIGRGLKGKGGTELKLESMKDPARWQLKGVYLGGHVLSEQ